MTIRLPAGTGPGHGCGYTVSATMGGTVYRFLEALFGGNMIAGTTKAMLWIFAYAALLTCLCIRLGH